jgi:hypothetical protein
MKKTIGLFLIAMISVLLIACEPPAVTDVTSSMPAITLSNATLNLTVGETKPIGITVRGFAASELRYVSQDASIARVNAAGQVTAVAPGAVLVTASYQDLSESVYVFVLPDLESLAASTATVVDVRLSPTNEVILVYSDGRLENTGIQAAFAAEQVTIRSAVVNAAGNLIVTLSDGSTINAGRVVGPSGPSGPAGTSGGGATGQTGAAGVSVTNATINSSGQLILTLSNGGTINAGVVSGGAGNVTASQIYQALNITEAQWLAISGLSAMNLTESGLRSILGFTTAQLDALVNSQGLLSYNRYKLFYPGYQGTESEWFDELVYGTLIVNVGVNLTASIEEIFYPSGFMTSGLLDLDYYFNQDPAGPKNASFSGTTVLSGTLLLATLPPAGISRTLLENIIKYGKGTIFDSLVTDNLAILDEGVATTLKGALLNPNPTLYPSGVSVFRNNPFNEYFNAISFNQWETPDRASQVTNGYLRLSGTTVFVVGSGASVQATYEPIKRNSLSEIDNFTSYSPTSSYNNLISFLLGLKDNNFLSGLNDLNLVLSGVSEGSEPEFFLIDANMEEILYKGGSSNEILDYVIDFYTPHVGLNVDSYANDRNYLPTMDNPNNILSGVFNLKDSYSNITLTLPDNPLSTITTNLTLLPLFENAIRYSLLFEGAEGYYSFTDEEDVYLPYIFTSGVDEYEVGVKANVPAGALWTARYLLNSFNAGRSFDYTIDASALRDDNFSSTPNPLTLNESFISQEFGNQNTDSNNQLLIVEYRTGGITTYSITGDIAGNYLDKWDIFYSVVSSSGVFRESGILASSGFNYGSGVSNTSLTNSGFIMVTSPFGYSAFVNTTGFVGYDRVVTNPLTTVNSFDIYGETYTSGNTIINPVTDQDNRNLTISAILIASLADKTFADGDVIYIRSEVNHRTPSNQLETKIQRYALIEDKTAPTLSGLMLASTNSVSPFVAKAGDNINIILRADEPVSVSYSLDESQVTNATLNKFYTSGATSSGLLTSGSWTTNNANELRSVIGSGFSPDNRFTLFTYQHISPLIAPTDKEGYFAFENLRFLDRAGRHADISSTDFPNLVWVDPVAPVVTVSGITISGVTETTSDSGLTVSGVINLEFKIAETFNDITSGLAYYSGVLNGSGFEGPFPDNSGLWSIVQSGITDSSNYFLFDYTIDTQELYNGEYVLTIYALDFVGNPTTFKYSFIVDNDVLLIGATTNNDANSNLVTEFRLEFNIPVTMSGVSPTNTLSSNVIAFRLINTSESSNFNNLVTPIVFTGVDPQNNKVLVFTIPATSTATISPFYLRVEILSSDKFADFRTTKEVSGNLISPLVGDDDVIGFDGNPNPPA